ncbi:MAG TPA: DUF222 domain-containing protein [Streptosporangiaceae bacterium]|nr:DUF222 domain-containing protein [Streptosporangiaceae bacterium]
MAEPVPDPITTWVDLPAARPARPPAVPEAIGAGFTREPGPAYPVRGAAAFEEGGPADVMGPCSVLAELTGQAQQAGLSRLTDDELIGVLRGTRRVISWQSAVELAAVAELHARRSAEPAGPGPDGVERTAAELGVALTLTSPSAQALTSLALSLTHLTAVADALARGDIDVPRARVFAEELASLPYVQAAAISDRHIYQAPGLTTSQLRARLRRAVIAVDPEALRRRQQQARRDARVMVYGEPSGNTAITGSELPTARAVEAYQHLTALARCMQQAGMAGSFDQIRAAVFLCLLTGQSPQSLLPAQAGAGDTEHPAGADTPPPPDTGGTAAAPDTGGTTAAPDTDSPAAAPDPGGTAAGPHDDGTTAERDDDGPASAPDAGGSAAARDAAGSPAAADPAGPDADAGPDGRAISWPAGPLGTLHLTMPLATWLGLAPRPGHVTGYGPVDPWTARQLARSITGQPGVTYCLTITTPDGQAAGHACTTTPPPRIPPRSGPAPPAASRAAAAAAAAADWIAGLTIHWLETGHCSHPRQTAAYRPGKQLTHLLKVRNPTCTAPGCGRPALRSDIDHVIPFGQGGRTCECNCHAPCRRHHRLKGSAGWQLEMPQPGVLKWRLPHGRSYTVTPAGAYPD